MAKPARQSRTRGIEKQGGSVPQEIKDMAQEVFDLNVRKNAADRAYNKKRAELLAAMQDLGVKRFEVEGTSGRKPATLMSSITIPPKEKIDVRKLWDLSGGDDDKFYDTVSASKKSVDENFGKNITTQCTITVDGTPNVAVKVAK